MPEGYTHVRTARRAARETDMERKIHPAAFCAGANGPDEFFCYQIWKSAPNRDVDLPALGRRMHHENTGRFLMSLVEHAETPVQQSYVLGFLSHYITDCILHPYVNMISGEGQLYAGPGGHGYFEIALDSELHARDYKSRAVSAAHSNPRMAGTPLIQVSQLLQTCLKEVYGLEIGLEPIADAFHHAHFLRSCFVSRLGVKKLICSWVEPLFGGKGFITGHVSPARFKNKLTLETLPARWKNPYTGQECEISVEELLSEAVRKTVTAMFTCQSCWKGRTPKEELARMLGSRSYESGLEDACSLGQEEYRE